MTLPLVNTWNQLRGDSVSPVLSGDGSNAFAVLDSDIVVSGLTAIDNEAGDISSYVSIDELPYTGYLTTVPVIFSVRDRWGNGASLEVQVPVTGEYVLNEIPYLDTFDSEDVGEYWSFLNGDFQHLNGNFAPLGELPASPRWNAVYFSDSNAHIQATFNQGGSATVGGILFRYVDANNFYYLNFDGANAQLRLIVRVNGVYTDVYTNGEIVAPSTEDFTMGIRLDRNNITIIYEGVPVFTAISDPHLYGKGHGILFNAPEQYMTEFRIARPNPLVDVLTGGTDFPAEIIVVPPTPTILTITVLGLEDAEQPIVLWNLATKALLFEGDVTVVDSTFSIDVGLPVGSVVVGVYLGTDPLVNGTGLYGVVEEVIE